MGDGGKSGTSTYSRIRKLWNRGNCAKETLEEEFKISLKKEGGKEVVSRGNSSERE